MENNIIFNEMNNLIEQFNNLSVCAELSSAEKVLDVVEEECQCPEKVLNDIEEEALCSGKILDIVEEESNIVKIHWSKESSDIMYVCLKYASADVHNILKFVIENFDERLYENFLIQESFHTTLLFTGKKENNKLGSFLGLELGIEYEVNVDRIAISDKFVVIGLSMIEGFEVPYHGNPIIHITVGRKKGFRDAPVKSPMAFNRKENIYDLSSFKLILKGTLGVVKPD